MEIIFSMSNCRSGCPTQDHANWGECARDANLSVGNATIAATLKKNGNELNAYREARKQGIQPRSTKMADIQTAVRLSDKVGKAVQA
jgi:hypothetical protein